MNKFEKENERIKDDIVRQYGRSLDYPTDCDALADEISTAKIGRASCRERV